MQPHSKVNRTSSISLDETVLTLPEAAAAVPTQSGKRPSVSTIWRWCRKGLRGIRLEYLRCGRRILTSHQALDRFFIALAEQDQLESSEDRETAGTTNDRHKYHRTNSEREDRVAKANKDLDRNGF